MDKVPRERLGVRQSSIVKILTIDNSAQAGVVKPTKGKVMKLHRGRFAALIGTAVAGVSVFLAAPAMASPHSTPTASVAAVLRAEIKAQLAYNPSGTVISDNEVSYDNGHFIVTVPTPGAVPAYAGGCPSGWLCIFSGADYTVHEGRVQYPLDTDIAVHQYLPGNIGSLSSARRTGSILSNRRGGTACYPGGASTTSVGSPFNAYPYIYLERSANCN